PSDLYFFLYMLRPQPLSTLFPYTTLFRSRPSWKRASDGQLDESLAPWSAPHRTRPDQHRPQPEPKLLLLLLEQQLRLGLGPVLIDRKSTRLNSSHRTISYAVFCLKKKKK